MQYTNNTPTSVWGPHFWYVIHITAFNYPKQPNDYHKMSYRNFYESIGNVLPCLKCQQHYRTYLSKYPIAPFLDNRDMLVKWAIDLHNIVNKSLGKPIYSYQQVYNIYNVLNPINPFLTIQEQEYKFALKKENEMIRNKHYGLIIIFTLIIAAIYYFKKKYYYIF